MSHIYRYRLILQLLHVSQFLSSFIHCWCMRKTTPHFCDQFIVWEFITGQEHLMHSSCGLLEDLSPEISIAWSAGLVDFINPILKCLSVCAIKDFDESEHCVIHFVSAGSCQLLKYFCWLLWLAAIISRDLDWLLASSINVVFRSWPGMDPREYW